MLASFVSQAKYRSSLKAIKATVEAQFGPATATDDDWEVDLLASMCKEYAVPPSPSKGKAGQTVLGTEAAVEAQAREAAPTGTPTPLKLSMVFSNDHQSSFLPWPAMLSAAFVFFDGKVTLSAKPPSHPEVSSLLSMIDSEAWAAKLPQREQSVTFPMGNGVSCVVSSKLEDGAPVWTTCSPTPLSSAKLWKTGIEKYDA